MTCSRGNTHADQVVRLAIKSRTAVTEKGKKAVAAAVAVAFAGVAVASVAALAMLSG